MGAEMRKNPTVREIVKTWLEQHGYDGLVSQDWGCGCRLESLMPCNSGEVPYCIPEKEVLDG